METGITHSYELKGSKGGITAKVTVTEEVDVAQNRSRVSVAVSVKSSAYYNYTYYLTGSVKVEGEKLVSMNASTPTHYVTPAGLDSYYRVRAQSDRYTGSPWQTDISHHADGSRSIRVEISLKGYTAGGGGGSGWSVADSREVELTHIPRANAIGASDAFVGAVSTVSVVRRSADYTHSVAYRFGALEGYLDESGNLLEEEARLTGSSIPFTIPESFYTQIPNAPSGVCTLTCRTYQGDTQVGDDQEAVFTVTANRAVCAPEVTATVTDGNPITAALTGGDKLVRYASEAVCTVTATAKNGASIVQKTAAGQVAEDTVTLPEVQTGIFRFAAVDSRGYAGEITVEKELIPYTRPTAVVTARRTDPTSGRAILTVTGSWYNGAFGEENNALTVRCDTGSEVLTFTPTWEGSAYRLTAEVLGLDYLKNHTLTVEVADLVDTVTATAHVGKGIPVFHWGEQDFAFQVPVSLRGNRLMEVAAPQQDTDSVNKAYTDAGLRNNLSVALLAAGSLSGTATMTAPGGWSTGYRLYMIAMTMADQDDPMVQLLIPREAVTGQLWSVSTAASSKKLRISHNGEDLTVEAVDYTGNGGGSTALIYGLFPNSIEEENEWKI